MNFNTEPEKTSEVDDPKLVSDIAFRDPLTEETRKVRVHLLFVAALTILVKTYDLKLTKAPWLEFDIPASAPQVLDGSLSAVLIYLLFVFCLYSVQDFLRWRVAGEVLLMKRCTEVFVGVRGVIGKANNQLDEIKAANGGQTDRFQELLKFWGQTISEQEKSLAVLRLRLIRLNSLQWFRVLAVEIFFPMSLGFFAWNKVSVSLLPFMLAALK